MTMQYFIPFWPGDDIYETFNPWTDKYNGTQKRIWECFNEPPIDGVLVSRVNIERTNHLRQKAEREGIHAALRFYGPIMGDCGAFSYVDDPKPRYEALQTLSFYKDLGFDIGVTVDHLIVKTVKVSDKERRPLTDAEKEERWNLTIENAKKMFDEAQKTRYEGIRLIGITQGWDEESYARGIRELLEHGFNYVGLGGLAKKPTITIQKVLFRVHKEIKEHLKERREKIHYWPRIGLHLFGVARKDLFTTMLQCGVTSFDSASPLRMAWTSGTKNYMMNEHFYTAIRIREARNEKEKLQEKIVFQKLKEFAQRRVTADEFAAILKDYDPKGFSFREKDVLRTLKDKPWEKCDCPICTEIGLHVCIFRGCERNMRRGFHNVYHFHKILKKKYPRILALTWCTSEKDPSERLLPAYMRYAKSNIFKTFWENVHDLPIEIGILSGKYMLISWDTMIPYYEQRLTSETLLNAIRDLKNKLRFYDKVFFIGLGLYREAVEKASSSLEVPIEIFPKAELSRGKLDVIEYNRQMKNFREAILDEIKSYYGPFLIKNVQYKKYKQTTLVT